MYPAELSYTCWMMIWAAEVQEKTILINELVKSIEPDSSSDLGRLLLLRKFPLILHVATNEALLGQFRRWLFESARYLFRSCSHLSHITICWNHHSMKTQMHLEL